jgi:molybdenum cofactor cytidylyltransferase
MASEIGAIVLAAGMSVRMEQPKLLLPWGKGTIIEEVIHAVQASGIADIIVVTGAFHQQIAPLLASRPIKLAFNPHFEDGSMLHSLQVGLSALPNSVQAALVALGDQPTIDKDVIGSLLVEFRSKQPCFLVPSFQGHRGHPWIFDRQYFDEIMSMQVQATMRDFLNLHSKEITYLDVETDSILIDIDTPQDYQRLQNKAHKKKSQP